MNPRAINPKSMRLATWSGPLLTLLFFIGLIPLAQFIPPPHPTDTAEEIKAFYVDNVNGIRAGMVFIMIGVGMIAPFGVALAVWTRRSEAGFPVLTYIQLTSIAVGTMVGVLIALFWGVAAFRPDDTSADLTRMLNDIGWFFFLFDWPPFIIWFVAFALGILWDKSDEPAFPRWSAWLTLWVAFLTVPAGLMIFFKTGPFAFNGFLAMYIPLTVFFVWIMVMAALALKAIKRQEARDEVEARSTGTHDIDPAPASVA